MGSEHTVADDIVYDLISIQYHALKGAEVYDKFLEGRAFQRAPRRRRVHQTVQGRGSAAGHPVPRVPGSVDSIGHRLSEQRPVVRSAR